MITSNAQTVAGFQAAWGTGFQVLLVPDWEAMFGLANSPSGTNEMLTLRNSSGVIQDEANYDDEGAWPSDSPDGPSIYVRPGALTAAANDDGANWRRSVVGLDGAYQSMVTGADHPYFTGEDIGSPGRVVLIPEPTTLLILSLGGLGAAIRRRTR